MCGIAGFFQTNFDYRNHDSQWEKRLQDMQQSMIHRGPNERSIWLQDHVGFAHTRLSIIDVNHGKQPMQKTYKGNAYSIIYNGELYNTKELKELLQPFGADWETKSDTEVLLFGLILMGPEFIKKINGVFAFAFYNEAEDSLLIARDAVGVKPLFYQQTSIHFVFGSEPKALFASGITPKVNEESFAELFAVGPAHTPGHGVFEDMKEVLPGHFLRISGNAQDHDTKWKTNTLPVQEEHYANGITLEDYTYWTLDAREHTDSYEETLAHLSWLIKDSVIRQMQSDVPICTFLSGGLDSSYVSAICSQQLKKQGKQLDTYSFDFTDSQNNFKPNVFQSSLDRPYVDIMVKEMGSSHTYLECDSQTQLAYLFDAVDARDIPCMADIESSMLYFCTQVSQKNQVALTGECADELFGGYPWFHKEALWEKNMFPWSYDFAPRKALLQDSFLQKIRIEEYAQAAYNASVAKTPQLHGELPKEKRRREISWLNISWFMMTLLNRMDRTSMYAGLEARVPFADIRILEYVYNVPWDMKCRDGVTKSLLIETAKQLLPDQILNRKKSPYPKTYDTNYEKQLAEKLKQILQQKNSPILEIVDKKKTLDFLDSPKDYGRPWYGQLMAGPQLIAYFLQINYWLEKYQLLS